MKDVATFTATSTTGLDTPWDFVNNPNDDTGSDDIWSINSQDNDGYPFLDWEGYPTSIQPQGDGSSGNPYKVTNIDELYWITQNPASWDKDFIQMNDISAADTRSWDNGAGLLPVGYDSPYFAGSYDGGNFSIDSLYINRPGLSYYTALFGNIQTGATVENLSLSNINITGDIDVGGLAGKNSGTIIKCSAKGAVTGTKNVGGLAGNNWGPLEECYTEGSISATEIAGGLTGFNTSDINNCYSVSEVTATGNRVGGLIGELHNGLVERCYAAGKVSGAGDTGGITGYLSDGNVYYTYWDKETTGQESSAYLSDEQGKTTEEMKVVDPPYTYQDWDFTNVWAIVENVSYPFFRAALEQYFAGGNGTVADPYRISNADQLQDMWKDPSAHYIVINDIDASETENWNEGTGFIPVGNELTNFEGSINGDGYTITGLYINRPAEDNTGLTGYRSSGKIANLILEEVDITGNKHVGGITGYTNSNDSIVNCAVTGVINANDNFAGGLAGKQFSGVIHKCYADINITAHYYAGGLVGESNYEVSDCFAMGTINVSRYAGGINGITFYDISNCYSTCRVIGDIAGGITPILAGANAAACYWDTLASGISVSDAGTGYSTQDMQYMSTYTAGGWDFTGESANGEDDTWGINPAANSGYPFLIWMGYSHVQPSIPSLTTTAVTNISENSAESGGTITGDGGDPLTAMGVCWNKSGSPTLSDSYTEDESDTDTFISELTGLETNTTYYVRAYAINSIGTAYGNEVSFSTLVTETENTEYRGIAIYPNPVNNILKVEIAGENQDDYYIMNISGQVIRHSQLTGNEIDVSSLDEGMYILKINDHFFKIIKE